jgi:hypothetical protein
MTLAVFRVMIRLQTSWEGSPFKEGTDMGLVTNDLADWLTDPKDVPENNPFGASTSHSLRDRLHTGWEHAVCRLRKWLRTDLEHHGEHGDGFTR